MTDMQTSTEPRASSILYFTNVLLACLVLVLAAGMWTKIYHVAIVQWQQMVASSVALADTPPSISLPRSTLQPLSPCPNGTVVVIVAHQDDGLLFMNPDIERDISAGKCIQTVYLTSGDGGFNEAYWQSREAGSEAAYAAMFGAENNWQDRTATIGQHQLHERVLTGHENQASLVFLRLPDGGLQGDGFASTAYESLSKLQSGTLRIIHAVDDGSSYNYQQIVDILRVIITTQRPAAIYAQESTARDAGSDHSDHRASGLLALRAAATLGRHYKLRQYTDYPIGFMPENVAEAEALRKQQIFEIYAHFDPIICANASAECPIDTTYGNYFSRMYAVTRWP